jgi:hypothetical protein
MNLMISRGNPSTIGPYSYPGTFRDSRRHIWNFSKFFCSGWRVVPSFFIIVALHGYESLCLYRSDITHTSFKVGMDSTDAIKATQWGRLGLLKTEASRQ